VEFCRTRTRVGSRPRQGYCIGRWHPCYGDTLQCIDDDPGAFGAATPQIFIPFSWEARVSDNLAKQASGIHAQLSIKIGTMKPLKLSGRMVRLRLPTSKFQPVAEKGPLYMSIAASACESEEEDMMCGGMDMFGGEDDDEDSYSGWGVASFSGHARSAAAVAPRIGQASAAKVSRGSEVEGPLWQGVWYKNAERDPHQHITVTVVLYHCVAISPLSSLPLPKI
jgi:hypothetical protein